MHLAISIQDVFLDIEHPEISIVLTITSFIISIISIIAIRNTGFYNCLIFDLDSLSVNGAVTISDLREMGYSMPVIVFSEKVEKEAFDRVRKLQRVVMIEKPFEPKDLWGICEKLLQGKPVFQRVFRRFPTSQLAAVEKTMTGEKYSGNIVNLSRGGAYMQLSSGHVLPGDLLKLSIESKTAARRFDIDAQVVWSKPEGENQNKSNVGLRFMKSEDVYRTLLHRL